MTIYDERQWIFDNLPEVGDIIRLFRFDPKLMKIGEAFDISINEEMTVISYDIPRNMMECTGPYKGLAWSYDHKKMMAPSWIWGIKITPKDYIEDQPCDEDEDI